MSEIVRIVRYTKLLDGIISRLGVFFKRMLKQGADSWEILCQCKKAMDNQLHLFVECDCRSDIIIEKVFHKHK